MSTKSSKRFNYVIFYVSSIKNSQFFTFWGNFQFLVKSKMAPKMAAILDDVTGPPTAWQPIICTSSCRAHHRLSTKGEIFSKYANITKTQGRVRQPPLLVPRWGCDCLYVRGLICFKYFEYINILIYRFSQA